MPGIFTMELLPKRATLFDQGDATKVVIRTSLVIDDLIAEP